MDYDFMIKSLPLYGKAILLTLELAIGGILLAFLMGVICSAILYYRVRILKTIVSCYIEIARNTPLLIQLFFLYYGLPKLGIKIEAFTCAIMGLAFLGGGYMAEALRSGFESVEKIQIESGASIGLSQFQVFRYILFPQALAVAIPAVGANIIFLLKETSIVSAIALADLMYVAKDLIGMYYKTTEAFVLLIGAYLLILLPLSVGISKLERRLRYAGFGD
ncbi:amino acid ABC transporter permease [Anaerosinus sp.]|uniref:amino acid ABC transporter permease n=1 Tax=Selenobaculum sp. TaxID=3074374 RepID=UPI0015B0F745